MNIVVIRISTVRNSTLAIAMATIPTVSSLLLSTSEETLFGCAVVV